MSEQDNLHKADGKEELQSTGNNTETSSDTVTEKTIEITEAVTDTAEKTSEETKVTIEDTNDVAGVTSVESDNVATEETPESLAEDASENTNEVAEKGSDITEPISEENIETTQETSTDSDNATTEDTPEAVSEDADNEIISEIEESNAEDAEDEGNSDRHAIEVKDYDKMSLEELTKELERLITDEKIQAIKAPVEAIKTEFNSQFNALLDEKKEEFLNGGGNEIDFYFSSPTQKHFKDTFRAYRDKLNAHYKSLEKSLKGNLENRLRIIEDIKGLFNTEENINTTYKHFKELQEEWKTAGPIPRDRYNNAWNSYHHHVEVFYDFLHLNRDLRDLDFKHNLVQKLKIIERAEELAQDDNLNRAFRELQVLHKMWKEELGPVAKEEREGIWQRFKDATKLINDKRQVYFSELDKVYEQNLEKKHTIISDIISKASEKGTSHNTWQNKIKEVEALRQEFFNAGKVPVKVNEATWAKFKDAVRTFNRSKNAFYKNLKKDQFDNLQKKIDLIKVAEENKDSEDFETTTPLMKKIQNEWKKIGHVPRKESDKVWNQFKSACNHYFDKFHAIKDASNKEGNEAYLKKVALLDEMKGLKLSGKKNDDLKLIKSYIAKWKTIGDVPPNKRYIQSKLNKALDGLFKSLDLNKTEAELIKFENKLEQLSSAKDSRFLDNEHSFIRKKITEVKSEINQLENNLQFFRNVKDDNPLVKEVHKNINNQKDTLKLWETKLIKIKALY